MRTGDQPSAAGRPTHPGRPRRRLLPRLHLPQGINAEAAPRGSRPTAVAAAARRRRTSRRDMGRGVRADRRAAAARSSPSTDRTPWRVYLGNPNAHNLSGIFWLRPLLRALGTRNIFSASTVDQMPRHVSSGSHVRQLQRVRGARHRSHRLPADAGRQPVRVERIAGHRARLAGTARGDPGAGWSHRRRRSAPDEDGCCCRRAPVHPPRHRRAAAVRARRR